MADTYKRLGTATFAVDDQPQILYQTEAGKSSIISNITLVNTHPSLPKNGIVISIDPNLVSLSQMSGYLQADGQRIYLIDLEPGETLVLEPGIVIGEEHTIVVKGMTAVTVSVFGLETDDSDNHYKMFEMLSGASGNYIPVPAGSQHIYRSILLHNVGVSTDYVSMSIGSQYGEASGEFIHLLQVNPGETVAVKLGIGAISQQSLVVYAPLSNIKVFGVELSV